MAAGGRVNLQGHFNLGTDNVVYVTNDVEIIGEAPVESGPEDPVTGNRDRTWPTKITGGGAESGAVIFSNEKVNVTIRNINFDRYQYLAIRIRKATFAEVSNCKITNGLPEQHELLPIYNAVFGLEIGGTPSVNGGVDYASVDQAVVKDNVISIVDDGLHYDSPPWVLTLGIGLVGMLDGTRVVSGNLVTNFSHLGIHNRTHGTTTIENNRVIAGNGGNGVGQRTGIAPDWYGRLYFAAPVPLGKVYVRNNAIETDFGFGPNNPTGVWANNFPGNPLAEDTEIVIEDNHIQVDGRYGIIGIGPLRNVTCRDNVITGQVRRGIDFAGVNESMIKNNNVNITADHSGIAVWAASLSGARGNTIIGNKLTGSAPRGILVGDAPPYPWSTDDNSFVGNDLSEFSTSFGIFSTGLSNGNHFTNNTLGSAVGWGVYSAGTGNEFQNTTFSGDYLGFGFLPVFVLLDVGSQLNEVTSVKDDTPPYAFDVCDQVVDLNTPVTTNIVPGYDKCDAPGADVVERVEEMIEQKEAEMNQMKDETPGEPGEQ